MRCGLCNYGSSWLRFSQVVIHVAERHHGKYVWKDFVGEFDIVTRRPVFEIDGKDIDASKVILNWSAKSARLAQAKAEREVEVEYDDEAPCLICEEPVIGASMGGTAICGSCDMGKCRYCGITTFVMKESVDGGASKRNLLDHMKWHRKHDPTIPEQTQRALKAHRALAAELRAESAPSAQAKAEREG